MHDAFQLVSILKKHYDIYNPILVKLEGYDSINHRVETLIKVYVLKVNTNSA